MTGASFVQLGFDRIEMLMPGGGVDLDLWCRASPARDFTSILHLIRFGEWAMQIPLGTIGGEVLLQRGWWGRNSREDAGIGYLGDAILRTEQRLAAFDPVLDGRSGIFVYILVCNEGLDYILGIQRLFLHLKLAVYKALTVFFLLREQFGMNVQCTRSILRRQCFYHIGVLFAS
jgi:hypothetical protein